MPDRNPTEDYVLDFKENMYARFISQQECSRTKTLVADYAKRF
jgi:hypothetical protein